MMMEVMVVVVVVVKRSRVGVTLPDGGQKVLKRTRRELTI